MNRLGIVVAGLALVAGAVAVFPAPSTAAAQITEIIDSTGDGAGNILDLTRAIAVDGSGNVYVTGLDSDNAFKIAPSLPVGGVAELPPLAGASAEESAAEASEPSVGHDAALAAGLGVAAAIALGGAAWYARRRWVR